MSGKPSKLVYLSLVLASSSLLLSGVCILQLYLQREYWKGEITARLSDLEAEHDYLLDSEKSSLTSDESSSSRPSLCQLLPDPGPCSSQVTRWYFLRREGDCLEFPWGGCQGNDNNFLSLDQCRSACLVSPEKARSQHLVAPARSADRPLLPPPIETFDLSNCLHAPDSGPCFDRITRFYYEDGECKRFDYGGCAGNSNNFFTEGECLRKCVSGPQTGSMRGAREDGTPVRGFRGEVPSIPRDNVFDACAFPEDQGSCDESLTRYRWDSRIKQCVRFTWSGCGGNSNNFISAEKCRNRCDI